VAGRLIWTIDSALAEVYSCTAGQKLKEVIQMFKAALAQKTHCLHQASNIHVLWSHLKESVEVCKVMINSVDEKPADLPVLVTLFFE
jgi:hypothetical protein